MKKLAVLAALTLMSLSATCFAQKAVVNLNNWDVDKAIQGIPAGQTAYVQLLGGASASALAPVVSTASGQSVFQVDPDGHFDAGVGIVPGLTATGPASYNLQSWVGAAGSTYATATLKGETGVFSGTANAWNDTVTPLPLPIGSTLTLPATAITLSSGTGPVIPEPSTIALGLIGAGALLIRRRK